MLKMLEIPEGMYRNIGTWNQFPVYSIDEIIKVVETHLGFKHLGISMCAYDNGCQYLLYLPFDFDDEKNLRNPWNDAKKLYNQCVRSEEHTSELQSHSELVCRLLLEKKKH